MGIPYIPPFDATLPLRSCLVLISSSLSSARAKCQPQSSSGLLRQCRGRCTFPAIVFWLEPFHTARYEQNLDKQVLTVADARTITALTLGTSLLCYGGLLSFQRVLFILPWVFKFPFPEVWRLVTPFWITGPKLSIIFDTIFCELTCGLATLYVPDILDKYGSIQRPSRRRVPAFRSLVTSSLMWCF